VATICTLQGQLLVAKGCRKKTVMCGKFVVQLYWPKLLVRYLFIYLFIYFLFIYLLNRASRSPKMLKNKWFNLPKLFISSIYVFYLLLYYYFIISKIICSFVNLFCLCCPSCLRRRVLRCTLSCCCVTIYLCFPHQLLFSYCYVFIISNYLLLYLIIYNIFIYSIYLFFCLLPSLLKVSNL